MLVLYFWVIGQARCSVEHTALVGGDHVLDVNEGVIATMLLEKLERLLDQVAQVLLLALRVVNSVALVEVLLLEEVHDGENLTVVGHEGLTDGVTAEDERLEDVECRGDNIGITGVEGGCKRECDKKV